MTSMEFRGATRAVAEPPAASEMYIVCIEQGEIRHKGHRAVIPSVQPVKNCTHNATYFNIMSQMTIPYEEREFAIWLYGRDADNRSMACLVPYPKRFVMELPETHATVDDAWRALMYVEDKCKLPRGTLATDHAKASFDPNRTRLNGYQGHGFPCITVSCKTKAMYTSVEQFLSTKVIVGKDGFAYRVSIHERDHIDPVTRFLGEHNVQPCTWVTLQGVQPMQTQGLCTTEVECWCESVAPSTTVRRAPKLKTMCLDLEVVPPRSQWLTRRDGPDANRFVESDHDPIRQCCVIVDDVDGTRHSYLLEMSRAWQGGVHTFRHVTYTTIMYPTERDLIAAISDFIRFEDPDVIVTHNGNRFDWPYLFTRYGDPRGSGRVHALGRRIDYRFEQVRVDGEYVSVHQTGDKADFTPHMPGRILLDSMALLQTGIMGAHGGCSLKELSTKYLPATATKIEFNHHDIFNAWHDVMEPERLAEILKAEDMAADSITAHELGRAYCVYDGCSTLDVVYKLGILPFVFELGTLTWCPAQTIIDQKQGRRLKSLLAVEAWKQGMVVNTPRRKVDVDAREGAGGKGKKYQGAFVFDTKIGVHGGASINNPPLDPQPPLKEGYDYTGMTPDELVGRLILDMITLLDFASLYPNTMRAACLSHDNFVDYDAPLLPSEQSAMSYAERFHKPLHADNELRKPYTPPTESFIQSHGSGQWYDASDAADFVTIFAPTQNPRYKSKVYRFRKKSGVLTRVLTNLLDARKAKKAIMKVFQSLEGPMRDAITPDTKVVDPKDLERYSVDVEALVLRLGKKTTVKDVLDVVQGHAGVGATLMNEYGALYDAQQGSRKVVCNSTYGICAYEPEQIGDKGVPHTSCPAIAASTTAWARQAIGRVVDHFHEDNIVMGDTDSVGPKKRLEGTYATQEEAVKAMWAYAIHEGEHINNEFFNDGVNDLETELVATLMICSSKKFYAALVNKNMKRPDDFNIMLKGLAPVRGDTPDVLSDMVMGALKAQFDHPYYIEDVRRKLTLRCCLHHLEQVVTPPEDGGFGVDKYVMMNEINKPDSVRGAHMLVAHRHARLTGEPIFRKARVHYVFVKNDPDGVVSRNGTPTCVERVDKVKYEDINRVFYLERRMFKYMCNLLGAMHIPERIVRTMFDWYIKEIKQQESPLRQVMADVETVMERRKTYEQKRQHLENMLDHEPPPQALPPVKRQRVDLHAFFNVI